MSFLPQSLFQLLELFVLRVPFEISMQVFETNEAVQATLLIGQQDSVIDYRMYSCGIELHTHPLSLPIRKAHDDAIMKGAIRQLYVPPTGADIRQALLQHVDQLKTLVTYERIPTQFRSLHSYVFDGKALWKYGVSHSPTKQELLSVEDPDFVEIAEHNANNNLVDFFGLRLPEYPQLKVSEFIINTRDLWGAGEAFQFDLQMFTDCSSFGAQIPETIKCIPRELSRTIKFPTGRLDSYELEYLYRRSLQILNEQAKMKEAPFG